MKRFDAWIGKTLFHPIIIAACHLTRQSQYAVHHALTFFAACHATYYAHGAAWGWVIVLWTWVIASFVVAAFAPDMEARSSGFIRGMFWFFFAIGVAGCVAKGAVDNDTIRALMILFAEYAATIKTLPPRTRKEPKVSGQMREVKQ